MAIQRSSKDTVYISKNKIYTSYFARACRMIPDRRLVSVSLSTPKEFGGAFARELNPTPMMIHNIKNNIITPEEYEEAYRSEILSKLSPYVIANKYMGKVLCCWEKPEQFCHRHIILNWLAERLEEDIVGGEV